MVSALPAEAINDHIVGANHNNKPAHGKTFAREQERSRSDVRADQYPICLFHYSLRKATHCISAKR